MFQNISGLSESEVKAKQFEFGKNTLPEDVPPSNLILVLQQVKSPLVYILLLASLVTVFIGHLSDAIIILVVVVLNTILGFIQENKAAKALSALKKYITYKVTVIRESEQRLINTVDLVPGDIVVLNQGTKVPADGKLLKTSRLFIEESILTGESMPVNKNDKDLVYMGTSISSGQGVMLVEKIGALTKMGSIAGQIKKKEDDTPFQKQLKLFSRQLVFVIGFFGIVVIVLGILYKFTFIEILTTSIALAVSSIPEGLLVSLTVILAIGMQKILKHKGLVKKLSAAETLGGVSVVCVDKTGTLTQGSMRVTDVVGGMELLAQQSILANDLDDPIVISAYEWAKHLQNNDEQTLSDHPRLDGIPFSSKSRYSSYLNKWNKKENMIFINGAPEYVLNKTKLSTKEKNKILNEIDNLTNHGRRVIGFIRKNVPNTYNRIEDKDLQNGFEWVGVLGFSDPVREGVSDAIRQVYLAGIRTIVITGDYPKTSVYVLKELGVILNEDEIMTGEELTKISSEELRSKVKKIKLFARTTPDQKLDIVRALKSNNEVIAMMGDGVNDAPALHQADIGVVVDNASDVAKESADLILLDSDFGTIVSSIKEGRKMFENIRKIILYLMSDAFAEIVVVIGGISMGLPIPITAVQILWINIISDGFPGLALTIDPVRSNIMNDKPRLQSEKIVNGWMISLISIVSLVAGSIALIVFIAFYKSTGNIEVARSMAFVTLGMNSLVYVFSVSKLTTPFWLNPKINNGWLVGAVVAGFILQIVPFTSEALRGFFGLSKLGLQHWLLAVGLSLVMFLLVEVLKFVFKKTNHATSTLHSDLETLH